MNQSSGVIEVIDRDGWQREYSLNKNIIHIGSAPTSDIVLEVARGSGVSARHVQLIPSPNQGYRLVNMGDTNILMGQTGEQIIAPRSFADVGDGTHLRIGDFKLVIRGGGRVFSSTPHPGAKGAASGSDQIESNTQSLGLKLVLSSLNLGLEKPIQGTVTVRNRGDQSGVQFILEVEGISEDYYEIGPGPVLFSNSEAEVFFRLYHPHKPRPLAGPHQIRIRATAPGAYASENVVVAQTVNIAPYYEHSLELLPAD